MKRRRLVRYVIIGFVFAIGLAIFLYPFVFGNYKDADMRNDANSFLIHMQTEPAASDPFTPEPEKPYSELLEFMAAYNRKLCEEGQHSLDSKQAYETPAVVLSQFGLDSEVLAVLSVPRLDLVMPVYSGANSNHMAQGAAILSQTSLPIGGVNSNCVIAGHRGWKGASYFLHITELEIGDRVELTNLWEKLEYRVCEKKIIKPNAVEEVLIQPGRDLVTLLTCHPYASGGKLRYLVICERMQ